SDKLKYNDKAVAILDNLIARYEAKVPTPQGEEPKIGNMTKSDEGQVKKAIPQKDLNFGDVTTCMTVTAFLADGTRVGAHEGQQARVGSDWSLFREYIGDVGISKIVVKGALSQWFIKINQATFAICLGIENLKPQTDQPSEKYAEEGYTWVSQLYAKAPFFEDFLERALSQEAMFSSLGVQIMCS
ncbi:hypothetical protein ACFLV6_03530, partial [Chloroflexota bacterium]